jgi:hypothetical protein
MKKARYLPSEAEVRRANRHVSKGANVAKGHFRTHAAQQIAVSPSA